VNYTWSLGGLTFYGATVSVTDLPVGNHTVTLNASVILPVPASVLVERTFQVYEDAQVRDPGEGKSGFPWIWALILSMFLIVLGLVGLLVFINRRNGNTADWGEE